MTSQSLLAGISSHIGDVVQFTGVGTGTDTYHRITGVTGRDSISIARTTGDPVITADNYAFITAPSVEISSNDSFSNGIQTITTNGGHGLALGNKFRIINSSNVNKGDFIVETVVGLTTFTFKTESEVTSINSGHILKHGLSSNSGVSDRTDENLDRRAITIFDGETLTLSESGGINGESTTTSFSVSSPGIAGTMARFPLGSYIQVENEIMRIASNSLSGNPPADKITVIRGALGSKPDAHIENSVIKKIKIPSIEFRRPSIIRASGHTFEYLGYGPGNYSTGLPQVQDRTLTEREEFLSQSQERSSGIVVYTGMNNKGDFYIGNQKKSSATGEETNFDIPVPTVTGEDPSRLSAVFDEVTIKERLVVEGGDSGQVLSQFGGPVTFEGKVKADQQIKITNELDSTSTNSGALVVAGGVGIGKTVNIGGALDVTGNATITGNTTLGNAADDTTTVTGILDVNGRADIDNIRIDANTISSKDNGNITIDPDGTGTISLSANTTVTGILTVTGRADIDNIKIDANTISSKDNGNITIDPDGTGTISLSANTTVTGNATITGNTSLGNAADDTTTITGDTDIIGNLNLTNSSASSGRISANFLDVPNVSPIGSIIVWPGALNTWPTTNWRLCNGAGGFSEANHPELWQVLRNGSNGRYGGNSSDFNLPNLQNRFVGGVGTEPLNGLGNSGGNKNAVLVAHNHGITEPNDGRGHRHEYNDVFAQDGSNRFGDESTAVYQENTSRDPETSFSTTGISINTRGLNADGAVNSNITGTDRNLPPYMALYWIIRIK